MAYTVSRERIAPVQVVTEATPGTAESISSSTAATNGLLTYNSGVAMNATASRIELRPHSSTFTRQKDIMGSRLWNLNFTTMMQGPGTITTADIPNVVGFKGFIALMNACASTISYVSNTSCTFAPSTLALSGKSATIAVNHDGRVFTSHSSLGSMKFAGNTKSGVSATFTGMGRYNTPSAVSTTFDSWSGGTQRAQAFVGATIIIDNGGTYSPVVKSFEFDMGVSVGIIEDANSANGVQGLFITDRNPTMSITIGADARTATTGPDWEDFYTDWLATAPQTHSVSIAYGSGTGNVVDFDFPTAQLVDVKTGLDNGQRTVTASYKVQHATPELEWTITIDSAQ